MTIYVATTKTEPQLDYVLTLSHFMIIEKLQLNKNPISTQQSAQVVSFSVDLPGYMETIKNKLEDALKQHFSSELSESRRALLEETNTEWDP